ncbi:DUF4158 domain-containing protein [Dongshaea marina]|uniref:DUF4158 domain-containing protein n=1 Tax=Dongshaea marina TaxID=2047966 RepID=UPI000D3E36BE|nr:DUF4158 domain-containing protein [Dongshaea marina]
MSSRRQSRIQILTSDEIDDLYKLPEFNQSEREEYFGLDDNIQAIVSSMDKLETRIYFILLLGYFRAKPVIPKFHLREVRQDVKYICHAYFAGRKPALIPLAKSTRHKLVNQVISLLGFKILSNEGQGELMCRLRDVATITTDPRYIFDESLAFFSQRRIALPGYTTIQALITEALSDERQRTEQVLSQMISESVESCLLKIMNSRGLLNSLSGYKGSARGITPSELDRELHTHQVIKEIYPELKELIGALKLSRGNLAYYASIVKHRSITKLRRAPKWQGLLYLSCYLYFRYRETNDKLVIAFSSLVKKHNNSAKDYANKKVAEELEVIRTKLKYAGSVLRLFVDSKVEDTTPFGDVRQQAFDLISEQDIQMISHHLDKNDFDRSAYRWEYTDQQSRKISGSLRKLFLALDIECIAGLTLLSQQLSTAKNELKKGKLKHADKRLIKPSDRPSLIQEGQVNLKRFEFYLYSRVVAMLDSDRVYISESEQSQRLKDDLIPEDIWDKDRADLVLKTGLERLITPIHATLDELDSKLNSLRIGV